MVFESHNISDAAVHLFQMENFGELFTKFWVLFKIRMCSAQFVYMARGRQNIYPRVELDIFSTKSMNGETTHNYRDGYHDWTSSHMTLTLEHGVTLPWKAGPKSWSKLTDSPQWRGGGVNTSLWFQIWRVEEYSNVDLKGTQYHSVSGLAPFGDGKRR